MYFYLIYMFFYCFEIYLNILKLKSVCNLIKRNTIIIIRNDYYYTRSNLHLFMRYGGEVNTGEAECLMGRRGVINQMFTPQQFHQDPIILRHVLDHENWCFIHCFMEDILKRGSSLFLSIIWKSESFSIFWVST